MEADGSFMTNHHVLNLTASPVTMYARFKLRVMDSAKVQHPVRTLICSNGGAINVPAHQQPRSRPRPRALHLSISIWSRRPAQSDVFYTMTNWDNPTIDFFRNGLMHL